MAITINQLIAGEAQSTSGAEFISTPTPGSWLVLYISVKSIDGNIPQIAVGDWSRNLWTQIYSGQVTANAVNSAAQITTQIWVCPNVQYAGWSQLGVYASPLYQSTFDVATTVLGLFQINGMTNGFLTVDSVTTASATTATTLSITLPAPVGGADCFMVASAGTDNTSGTITRTSLAWNALATVTAGTPVANVTTEWIESTTSQTVSWSSTVSTNWAAVAVAFRVTGIAPAQSNTNWPAMEFQLGFGQNLNVPINAVQWTTLPNRLMQWSTQRGIQFELGFVQSSPTDLTLRNDDGAFSPRAAGIGTAVTNGTATTLVVSNANGATMTSGDFFQLKTSGGAFKELNVFQITAIVVATNTTITFVRADGTAGGALVATVTGDIYTACPIDIYLPYRILASWNGTRYPVAVGWIERWPQTWNSPHWGVVQAVAVDAIATLTAQDVSPLRGEILSRRPQSYWPLNDPAGATTALNWGNGSTVLTQITSSNGGGTNGVASFGASTQSVKNDGSALPVGPHQVVSIIGDTGTGWSSSGMTGAEVPTKGFALRGAPGNDTTFPGVASGVTICGVMYVTINQDIINQTSSSNPTLLMVRSSAGTGSAATLLRVGIFNSAGTNPGNFFVQTWDKVTHASTINPTPNQGSWQLNVSFFFWAITFNQTSWAFYQTFNTSLQTGTCNLPTTFGLIDIAGEADSTSNADFMGGIQAHVAIFPRRLSFGELGAIDSCVQMGYPFTLGSNDAINRKLYYTGWNGTRVLNFTNYTSGSDIIGTTPVAEKIASIADYEVGSLFSDAAGQLQFRSHDQGATQTSRAIVGDRPDLGEIPFVGDGGSMEIDFDPTYIYNAVYLTNNGVIPAYSPQVSARTFAVSNAASIVKYGNRTLSKTVSLSSDSLASTVANNMLTKYALPKQRISSVLIDVMTSRSWAFALSVEVGDVITVNRRPIGAPAISITCVVLNVTHSVDAPNKWELTLVLAPR